MTTAAAAVITVREWLESRQEGRNVSTKTRFISAHQAHRVVELLQEHGYDVTLEMVKDRYAYNIARDVGGYDVALDGFYIDEEGYAPDLSRSESDA